MLIPLPYKILGGALFLAMAVGGAGWFGYTQGALKSKLALAEYQVTAVQQITDLKDKNADISDNVRTEYVDRVNTVFEKQVVYREGAAKLNPQYNLSKGWIELHDASATLTQVDRALTTDNTPSDVPDNSALAVVINNYSQCKQTREQLLSLQRWVRESKAANDAAAKEASK